VICAIVLAAGLSTRMGGVSKALLPVDERDTFVSRIVRTFAAAGIDDIVIVVGHQADRVAHAVAHSGVLARLVPNPRYAEGQLSSVITGIDAVDRPGVAATFLALVDAPLFTEDTVRALVDRFEQTGAPIVRPVRGNEHGHPILIRSDLFRLLRHADSTAGAKPIVRAHASPPGDVAVNDPGAFTDIDTPDDYARYVGRP